MTSAGLRLCRWPQIAYPTIWNTRNYALSSRVSSLRMFSHTPHVRAETKVDQSKLRNIGIIAHIDAGKTTTTERMLYYSGLINRIGDVDQGDTVMDHLQAERDRGITITSAAITFNWAGHRINLIDTPGHADFTFEVIRSIRVLDGAVTILDSVAGVEAQTEKVWKQASEMGIPKVIFVNKMDREGAGFGRTVREVVAKLNTQVGIVNFPYFEGSANSDRKFQGVVDVISKKVIKWTEDSDGKDVKVLDVSEVEGMSEECEKARTALIETLSEMDDELVEHYLEVGDYMQVGAAEIKRALRKATLEKKIVPVLSGASFRNIGVQPLLEAVIDYLPSPIESPPPRAVVSGITIKKGKQLVATPDEEFKLDTSNKSLTTALAFKVVNDPKKGMMVYVRVYSGVLQPNSSILNSTTGKREHIMKLYQMHSNEPIEVASIGVGNIGVIVGTKEIRTGDTIVAHGFKKDGIKSLSKKESHIQLNSITAPPPVFFSSIDPLTLADTKKMEEALSILLTEDPSLQIVHDEDSGQTMLSGMGELHLEISQDRLVNDLKARVEVGKIMVSYKETINQASATVTQEASTTTGAKDARPASASVTLSVEPVFNNESPYDGAEAITRDNIYITYPDLEEHLQIPQPEIFRYLKRGVVPGVARGGKKARLPLHALNINVQSIEIPPDVSSAVAVSIATRLAIEQALESVPKESYAVMEPLMDVRVVVSEEDIGTVVNDLSSNRRGTISSLSDDQETSSNSDETNYKKLAETIYTPPDFTMYMSKHGDRITSAQSVVRARIPLQQMVGYLNYLRSLTKGRGTFLMDFDSYQQVSVEREREILEESGF